MPTMRSPRILVRIFVFLIACFAYSFDAGAAYNPPIPTQLLLTVRETAGVSRTGEVVRSGVPLPRRLDIRSTASLAVLGPGGEAVPAEFTVTARWNAGKDDPSAPIQWLLVSFPATVGANSTATYRITTRGEAVNPAPARPLVLTRSGNLVTVDTGAAVFRLGSDPGALFDEILLDNGTRLVGGGDLTLRANGSAAGHSTTRRVWIEHSGPLSAVVVVEGAYDVPPIGNGLISSFRRYVFTAGSPTAVVRHAVAWEGNLTPGCNGCTKTSGGAPNGVLLGQVRDTLDVELGGAPAVTAVGDFDAPAVARGVAAGQTASVRQLLRSSRTAPLQFTADVAGTSASGAKADGGMLAASGPRGAVAVGLSQMHRYEPQALRLLADGRLAIDVVDDRAWVAHHQGLFATLAVSALPPAPSRPALDRLLWAPLNRPLHAWPQAAWFVASDAVEEFPVGALPAEYAAYDSLMSSVLGRTLEQIELLGLPGIMTFGVYPRYWGKSNAPGEVDCAGSNDPTPGESWDNLFWCGTWTDYHNTLSAVPVWAMRTGDHEWLDELAFPGALRTLHTQIMQCGPDERWFYCGQAPAGYNAYRSDFNSSHAYFENLYLYYWLTGDYTVVRTLQRGADSMRRFMCDLRGPGPVTQPHGPDGPPCTADYPVKPTASMTGRVGSQWLAAFRFVGLASDDPSFLEDFRHSLARAYTQQYAELNHNGKRVGLLGDLLTQPGPWVAAPILQEGLYDSTNLFRLLRDTGDAPIGNPALAPSHLLTSLARGITDVEMKVIGDGTAAGRWPHGISYTFTGSRIGGTLTNPGPNDRDLFTPEKTASVALLVRAGDLSGDAFLLEKGRELVQYTLSAAMREGAPLGKLHGQYLQRLPSAIARLAAGGSAPPPPAPTAPAAPGNLQAQAVSGTEVQLTWTDNSGNEESFRVERSINGAFQEIQTVPANATGARVSGLTAGGTFTFRVRAANGAGFSGYSNGASVTTPAPTPPPPPPPSPTVPAAPSGLLGVALSSSEVLLTWFDNSTDEASFRIERLINGIFTEIASLGPNSTGVRIGKLQASTSYTFRVRAANAAGYSAYSNSAKVTTLAGGTLTPPAAPSDFKAVWIGGGSVRFTWTDHSNNEANFRIEQMVNGVYKEVLVTGANVNTATLTTLRAGASYTFRIRASNASGYSAYSLGTNVNTF